MRFGLFLPLRNVCLSSLVCLSLALAGTQSIAQSTSASSTQAPKPKTSQAQKATNKSTTAKNNSASNSKPKPKATASAQKKKAAPAGTPQGTRGVNSSSNTGKALAAGATTAAVSNAASTKRAHADQQSGNPASGLRSHVVFVQDLSSKTVLFSRNDEVARPIASITKLMTALIVVDASWWHARFCCRHEQQSA